MKPPRRPPKPFTVEVRRGSRRSVAASFDKTADGQVSSQEIEAVDQPPESAPASPAVPAPVGRILPALDEAAPIPSKPRPARRPRTAAVKAKIAAPAIEASPGTIAPDPAAGNTTVTDPAPVMDGGRQRHRLNRLPRSAFSRADRWKARLPAISLDDPPAKRTRL